MCRLTGIDLFQVHWSEILQFEEFDIILSANASSSQIAEKGITWKLTLIIIAEIVLKKNGAGFPAPF